MFSVITNIYEKKTKGPTLWNFSHPQENRIFFLTTRDVRTSLVVKKKTFSVFLWM